MHLQISCSTVLLLCLRLNVPDRKIFFAFVISLYFSWLRLFISTPRQCHCKECCQQYPYCSFLHSFLLSDSRLRNQLSNRLLYMFIILSRILLVNRFQRKKVTGYLTSYFCLIFFNTLAILIIYIIRKRIYMKQKKVTFADIAAYTGFSKTTISRYFNNPDSLTLENQEKSLMHWMSLDTRKISSPKYWLMEKVNLLELSSPTCIFTITLRC